MINITKASRKSVVRLTCNTYLISGSSAGYTCFNITRINDNNGLVLCFPLVNTRRVSLCFLN